MAFIIKGLTGDGKLPSSAKTDLSTDLANGATPVGAAVADKFAAKTALAAYAKLTDLDGVAADLTPFHTDLMRRAFAPPAPADTPTVTLLNSADSPLRASGAEVKFKRIGDTNTGNVDIIGDTAFLVEGTPTLEPYGTNNAFVQAPFLPGGSTNQANYAASVETLTQSTNTEIEFLFIASGSTVNFRAYVDGQPMSLPQQKLTGLTLGNWYTVRFVFPTARARRVKLVFAGRPPIGSAYVPTGQTLRRPARVGPRVAVLGDSYEGGSGEFPTGGGRIEAAGYLAAHVLGASGIWNFGIGGTGYVNGGSSSSPFQTRVSAILASKPDILIVSGSVNDGSTGSTNLRNAVATLLSSVATIPEVYVTGPSLNATFEGNNTIVREETANAGRVYLDPLNPSVWLDPSMIGTDNVHPTGRGHIRRANRIAAGILNAREFLGYPVAAPISVGGTTPPPAGSTVLWSDDFNRADADTLGGDWTVAGGTAGIRSNTAGVLSTTGGTVYAVRNGQANGVLKGTVAVAGTGGPYFLARYFADASANAIVVRRNTAGNWAIQKRVAGVATYVHESTTPVASGDRVALKLDGTTVTLTVNDVQVWSGTITEHATNTLAGFGAWSSIMDYRIDDLSFETLPA